MARKTKKIQKNHKRKFSPIYLLGILIVIIIAGLLIYSVFSYQNSEQEKEGFFVCSQDGKICELSSHIHAEIELNACGEEIIFSKEEGELSKIHTHKETNKIHWHERMRVDPITRVPLDITALKISSFLKEMSYEFPIACNTNPNPVLSVTVNNSLVGEKLDYTWKDGDVIIVEYK